MAVFGKVYRPSHLISNTGREDEFGSPEGAVWLGGMKVRV